MKVKHDLSKCIGCGSCESVCSEVFEIGDDGKAHLKDIKKEEGDTEVGETDKECVKEAERICPARCIKVED